MQRICTEVAMLSVLLGVFAWGACSKRQPEAPVDDKLHTVAFGGDAIIGRRMNSFIMDNDYSVPLEKVAGILRGADLAVVNLEAIIATGGRQIDKGDRGICHFRGRPETVRILTEAGVDIASLANNHAGDYGPAAVRQGLEIIRKAGITPVGAGEDLKGALAPAYAKLGNTVVAVIAAHSTQRRALATPERAGNNFLSLSNPDKFVRTVKKQVAQARKYAHVVLFAVHWVEKDKQAPPSARMKKLARRLVKEAGIDALLGTGSHFLKGVELIDTKPVIYDVGNLIFDFDSKKSRRLDMNKSGLFILHLNSSGIRRVEVVPILLEYCRTAPASGKTAVRMMKKFINASKKFGTEVKLSGHRAVIEIENAKAPPPPSARYTEKKKPAPVLPEPASYRHDVVVDKIPESAVQRKVRFENGIELLAYEIPEKELLKPGVRIDTYWRAIEPLDELYSMTPRVEADFSEKKWRGTHMPGDWMYPTTWWKPGQIIRDTVLVTAPGDVKPGVHRFFISIVSKDGRLKVLEPSENDGPDYAYVGTTVLGNSKK